MESKGRKMLWQAAASGSAEIFADVALCPFEMTKVKMQVTLPGTEGGVPKQLLPAMRAMSANKAETRFPFGSLTPLCPFEMTKVKMQVTLPGQEGGVPKQLLPAMRAMSANKAETRFPFGSLPPLWGRQVPYTMIKFV